MISDHHGQPTGIATSLLTATDAIPGTHTTGSAACRHAAGPTPCQK
jgi:hypothetical protein